MQVTVFIGHVASGEHRIERRVVRHLPGYEWRSVRVDRDGDREACVLYGEGEVALDGLVRLSDRIALVVWQATRVFTALRMRFCCGEGSVLYEADYTVSRWRGHEFYRDLMGAATPATRGRSERPLRVVQ